MLTFYKIRFIAGVIEIENCFFCCFFFCLFVFKRLKMDWELKGKKIDPLD